MTKQRIGRNPMRIDAHQHFWSLEHGDYGWLQPTPALKALYRDFAPADLRPHLQAANIEGTVLVQAAPSEAETERLLEIGRQPDSMVLGVVGWCALEAADASERIARCARDPLLKGLRPMLQDMPDIGWVLGPQADRAWAAMEGHGLVLDLLIKPHQIDTALELLQRQPKLRAVVDHAAKPAIASGWDLAFAPWAAAMTTLARETNVACKLSGLLTEALIGADVRVLRPYVELLLSEFGAARLVWGSDWPVVTLTASYLTWHAMCVDLLADLDAREQGLIFGGNAVALYELDLRQC
ncbi:amidohydrolase family protein [Polaromonas sp.]|uniref:amidohydrolase family protein n=1 Tax=Polaromonas sp. TaxID=1869339 RepID=UPI003265685A